ncbi:hypothetical protein HDU67_002900 [Dinochytrium kinnereticum]|nr:hypothetical protein HDU67_002900 [Dinochytrium kinnereticum]
MPGVLTQLGNDANDDDRDQEAEHSLLMVGKAHYNPPPAAQEIQLKSAIAAAVQKKLGSHPNDTAPHTNGQGFPGIDTDEKSGRRLAKMKEETSDMKGKRVQGEHSPIVKPTETIALPEGWAEANTKDGRTYYIDHVTRTTTWTDPRTVPVNGRYRVKDHQGNIQEMVITARIGSQMTVVPANQFQSSAASGTASGEFFEDPRKKAEERIRKKLRDIKG